jgi:hypothetical protein
MNASCTDSELDMRGAENLGKSAYYPLKPDSCRAAPAFHFVAGLDVALNNLANQSCGQAGGVRVE